MSVSMESEYLVLVVLMFDVVALLMRKRPVIDLAHNPTITWTR